MLCLSFGVNFISFFLLLTENFDSIRLLVDKNPSCHIQANAENNCLNCLQDGAGQGWTRRRMDQKVHYVHNQSLLLSKWRSSVPWKGTVTTQQPRRVKEEELGIVTTLVKVATAKFIAPCTSAKSWEKPHLNSTAIVQISLLLVKETRAK